MPVLSNSTRSSRKWTDDDERLWLIARARKAEIELGNAPGKPGPPDDYRTPPDWFHAGQLDLWQSTAIDTVACAGTQGGKTSSEPAWLLREIQRCAPLIRSLKAGEFIFAGPTLTLLRAQAITHFKTLFQEELGLGRFIESPKPLFRFSADGLRRVLGFTDCPVNVHFPYTNDSSNLESMTALAGVWDEAGQKENRYESYGAYNRRLKVARSTSFEAVAHLAPEWWRVRFLAVEGPDATFGRRLWGTTPYEWGWFKTEVIDRAERKSDGFALYNWPSWMNPRVSEAECLSELDKGMPLWQWQMMYLGLFTRPAGVIYDTFDYESDTFDPWDMPANWPAYPGVDFGPYNMAGIVVREDAASGVLWIETEYHAGSATVDERVRAMKQKPRGGEYSFMPGAGGAHGEEDSRTAYRQAGLPISEPPANDVSVQIGCVYAELKTKRLKISRSCKRLIEQFLHYSYELGADGLPTDVIANKSIYHLLDAARYIVTKLRPPIPKAGHPAAAGERFTPAQPQTPSALNRGVPGAIPGLTPTGGLRY